MSDRAWRWGCGVVLLAAALGATLGLGDGKPLEAHEVFVARSAEEMIARGDWMVPYYDGSPRLNKPPLSYWLVIGLDRLLGADGRITAIEARLPSALAGLALVGMALGLGALLFDRTTALIAGLLVVSSRGFLVFTHNARPDMLYACLSTLGLLGFVLADRELGRAGPDSAGRSVRPTLLGWSSFGLAILAKGPQLPLIFLAGWLAGSAAETGFRPAVRALRPLAGICVLLAVSGWWFAVVLAKLPDAVGIWHHEMLDRVVGTDEAWWSWLNPYYLPGGASLVSPWVILYPLALLAPWLPMSRNGAATRRLWWLVAATLLLLSLSIGRHWYYALPAIVPLVLLMSESAVRAGRWLEARGLGLVNHVVLAAHVIGFALVILFRWKLHEAARGVEGAAVVTLVMAAVVAISAVLAVPRLRAHLGAARTLIVMVTFVLLTSLAAERQGVYWSAKRYERREFGESIARVVPPGERLLSWQKTCPEEEFLLRRDILTLTGTSQIERIVGVDGHAWLLVDAHFGPPDLPGDIFSSVVVRMDYDGQADRLQLWRLEARAPSTAVR